jgi:hypothetical protein
MGVEPSYVSFKILTVFVSVSVSIFGAFYKDLNLKEATDKHASLVREKMMHWFYGSCDRGGGRNKRIKIHQSGSPGSASSPSGSQGTSSPSHLLQSPLASFL